MTIPTPTSNGIGGFVPAGGGAPPPGLPDVATLERLASEFFAALPGAPEPEFPSSFGAGNVPAPELNLASARPSIVPAPVAPDRVEPTSGSDHLGVPEAYAAALPIVTPPQAPVETPLSGFVP